MTEVLMLWRLLALPAAVDAEVWVVVVQPVSARPLDASRAEVVTMNFLLSISFS
ncbi:unnamed protein product [Mycetohabitans rhizoxinica HKI 454]|uniref:Uncharacterized protein n=1 Tax=Mycetohabitans rhizoxinica (strain DSM 19002 / CIP 109453 / HKI 454) TaxID=882378 RepID=E5ARC1_MYCRK|nr:unnamed protein product [Mycetohabitans rhizoxinica HKI 454]